MKKTLTSALILILFSCSEPTKESDKTNYHLKKDDGIFVEIFDSTYVDENRYTENNVVFKEGSRFTYDFYHLSPEGEKFSFRNVPDNDDWANAWEFVSMADSNEHFLRQVIISTSSGLHPFIEQIPDYNQSIIKFEYKGASALASFNSMSGVIENEKNIWMHPPRDKYFRILELNPFPFIQAPYEIGNTWEWSLSIGSSWGDDRWKSWEGTIKNQYHYEIINKKTYQTKIGELACFEVLGKAQSEIGSTELLALFSPQYGFVKLEYSNIDGSKTVLELGEVKIP